MSKTKLKHLGKNISLNNLIKKENKQLHQKDGISNVLKILKNLSRYKRYKTIRNYPAIDGTTMFSAYINVGAVSIRQVYYRIKSLFW